MGREEDRAGSLKIGTLEAALTGGPGGFGGKAAGLARLLSAGARVPGGFLVEPTTLLPESWSEATRQEFAKRTSALLEKGPVAVRSSALGEDSAARSFAGLFETVLGARTKEEVYSAAARCIASGGGERVLAYAGTGEALPVGLVVQHLVPAAKAGTCITRDPLGRDRAALVEAVEGYGDALVSGRKEPERWRAYLTGLGTWECRQDGAAKVLDAGGVERIAREAASFERNFGCPLDLEWAIDSGGTLWWLQARPITSLKEPPSYVIRRSAEGADDGPITVWSNWNVRETVPDPMMPLTFAYWTEVILPMVGVQLFGFRRGSRLLQELKGLDQINGRVYFNMNCLMAVPLLGWLSSTLLSSMDAQAAQVTQTLVKQGVLTPRRVHGSAWRIAPSMCVAGVRGLLRFRRALFPRRALQSLERDGEALARRRSLEGKDDAGLLKELRLFESPQHLGILFGLQMETMAIVVYHLATRAFRRHPRALGLLATGIPANPTTQISLGIEELSEAALPFRAVFEKERDTRALLSRLAAVPGGPEWIERFRAFLDRFGHRGPMEFDLGAPRWSEDPSMILGLVRSSVLAPPREGVRERMERLAIERRGALAEAFASEPFWKRPYLRLMARLVVLYMPLREAPKHYGMYAFTRVRGCALELGRRLTARGTLARDEDVFFLEMDELVAAAGGMCEPADLQGRIAARKDLHARFIKEKAPDFLRSDGVPVEERELGEEGAEGTLRGTPISAGIVSGHVRIVHSPDAEALAEGDVLVASFADPGWTPLFPRASAVVMEVGGAMCHAAVVAREMGVPAVFGVPNATRLLKDGQRVTVDGAAGTVTIGD